MGKRGRPAGSKDNPNKPRSNGRWSAATREKHGAPPATTQEKPAEAVNDGFVQQPLQFAGTSGGSSSNSAHGAAHGDSADASAVVEEEGVQADPDGGAMNGDEMEEEEEYCDAEEDADDAEVDGNEARQQPRAGVEAVDIDDEHGLRRVTSADSIAMQLFRAVRDRLRVELSSRGVATDNWLLRHLKANDFVLRARDARKIFITYRCAVDMLLIDLLRPLSDAGVRAERFSDILLEIATKTHTRRAIAREQRLRITRQLDPNAEGEPLSEFGNQRQYGGCVPTGAYFAHVIKAYGRTTRQHMDTQVHSPYLTSSLLSYLPLTSLTLPHLCMCMCM